MYLCPTCHINRWTGHAELVSPTSLGDVFQLAKPVEGVRKEDGEGRGKKGRAKRNEGRLVNCPETRQIFHPTATGTGRTPSLPQYPVGRMLIADKPTSSKPTEFLHFAPLDLALIY